MSGDGRSDESRLTEALSTPGAGPSFNHVGLWSIFLRSKCQQITFTPHRESDRRVKMREEWTDKKKKKHGRQ